jgi:hypothetical protein
VVGHTPVESTDKWLLDVCGAKIELQDLECIKRLDTGPMA